MPPTEQRAAMSESIMSILLLLASKPINDTLEKLITDAAPQAREEVAKQFAQAIESELRDNKAYAHRLQSIVSDEVKSIIRRAANEMLKEEIDRLIRSFLDQAGVKEIEDAVRESAKRIAHERVQEVVKQLTHKIAPTIFGG